MLEVVLQKMLIEDDFMILVLKDSKGNLENYKLSIDENNKLEEVRGKILNFFSIKEDNSKMFFDSLNTNTTLREHVIEYSNEKYTYLLASERTGKPVAVATVWCGAAMPNLGGV